MFVFSNPGLIVDDCDGYESRRLLIADHPLDLSLIDVKSRFRPKFIPREQDMTCGGWMRWHPLKRLHKLPPYGDGMYPAVANKVDFWPDGNSKSGNASCIFKGKAKRHNALVALKKQRTGNFFGYNRHPWSLGSLENAQAELIRSGSSTCSAFSCLQLSVHKIGLPEHDPGLTTRNPTLDQQNDKRRYTDDLGNVIILVIGGAALFIGLFELLTWLGYRRISTSKQIGPMCLNRAKPDQGNQTSNCKDGSNNL